MRATVSGMTMSPPAATPWSRDAVFTTSPIAVKSRISPSPTIPTYAGPTSRPIAHLEPLALGRAATQRALNGESVADHRIDVSAVECEGRKVEAHHLVTDELVDDPVLDYHLRELGVEAIEAFGHLVRWQRLGERG